ncbi:hypothetical protein RCH09_003608 [Actimicrobium sp. GrIS 1.19]|uniref:hypothetical protein n=1 Tax=Actimicrobium sp. GrIS 1.19 TaxID=3071708 RepID=UPI002DFE52CA|nr:hypothetical protein [Actimicrobium sp. GrIS 1.19]
MNGNYFMSDAFDKAVDKAIEEAVAKSDALGLPKTYNVAPALPEQPVVVNVAGASQKKKRINTLPET